MEKTLRNRASKVLDLTHNCDSRGPRTFNSRFFVASWLDCNIPKNVRKEIEWLEKVIKEDQIS